MIRLALVAEPHSVETYAALAPRLSGARLSVVASSLEKLLAESNDAIDAVVIAQRGIGAETAAQQVAESAKHVLLAEFTAVPADKLDSLEDVCQSNGVRLMIGQPLRLLPAIAAVKQSLDSGKLGEPGLLRIHCWTAVGKSSQNESISASTMLPEIDLANWFFGRPPTSLFAVGRESTTGAGHDIVQLHMGFEAGGMTVVDGVNGLSGPDDYYSVSLIGSTGAAYADDHHNMQLQFGPNGTRALKTAQGRSQLLAQLQEFVDCLRDERDSKHSLADARLAAQVANAAAESMSSGRAARLVEGRYELL